MKGGVAIIPVGFRLDLVGVAAFCRQMYVDLCGMTKKPDSLQDTVYSCPEILGVATSRLVGCFAMGISARSSETAVGPSNTSHESGRETWCAQAESDGWSQRVTLCLQDCSQ